MPRPSRGRQSARNSTNLNDNESLLRNGKAQSAATFKENDRLGINDAFDPVAAKRAQIEQLITDIDKEVATSTSRLRSEAELIEAYFARLEMVWLIQLPKQVREMSVKDFVEVYRGDISTVMKSFQKDAPITTSRGRGRREVASSTSSSSQQTQSDEAMARMLSTFLTNPALSNDDRLKQLHLIKEQMQEMEKTLEKTAAKK